MFGGSGITCCGGDSSWGDGVIGSSGIVLNGLVESLAIEMWREPPANFLAARLDDIAATDDADNVDTVDTLLLCELSVERRFVALLPRGVLRTVGMGTKSSSGSSAVLMSSCNS